MSAATAIDDAGRERRQLERTWSDRRGFYGWLTSVDHKSIGKRYIVTAFVFFVLGGLLAVAMRLQLARPENHLVGPDLYNQLFTMHGSTMMFLFAVPVMEAMAVYLVPLTDGTRNIAFPRLNAFSYWVYLFGGVMLYTAFFLTIASPFFAKPFGTSESPKGAKNWRRVIAFGAPAVPARLVRTQQGVQTPLADDSTPGRDALCETYDRRYRVDLRSHTRRSGFRGLLDSLAHSLHVSQR
jgi:hypothetical protein